MDAFERKLLDAVLDAPDDDSPRLVYADWLMERGDPRGELIALQCRPQDYEENVFLRITRLIEDNKKTWLAPFDVVKHSPLHFVRGFVERIEVSAADWRGYGRELCAVSPIRELLVTEVGSLASVLAAAWSERLRSLEVGGRLDGKLEGMTRVPPRPRLETIVMRGNGITAAQVDRLVEMRGVTPRMLVLDGNPIGASGLVTLATSELMSKVTWLSLDYIDLDASAAEILGRMSQLESLSLVRNHIGPSIEAIGRLAKLERLVLKEAAVSVGVMRAIGDLPKLRHLDLTGCKLGDVGVVGLCERLEATGVVLRSLAISGIDTTGAQAIVECRALDAIEEIKLTVNRIDHGVREALVARFGGRLLLTWSAGYSMRSPGGRTK